MKKVLKITLLSVSVTIVIAAICVWMEFGTRIQGALSVQKVDEGLYYMEYRGDDGLEGLLAQGGFEDNTQLADYIMTFLSKGHYRPAMSPQKSDFGCSALTVTTPEGAVLMGRNFDFPSATGVILHTIPDQGYESIATFNVEFFGFGQDYKPEGFANQFMALSCLFAALDGVNEKGFAMADLMAGDNVVTRQQSGRPQLSTTAAIRYLLKKEGVGYIILPCEREKEAARALKDAELFSRKKIYLSSSAEKAPDCFITECVLEAPAEEEITTIVTKDEKNEMSEEVAALYRS